MTEKTIVLTGGGTAGHIMPNVALLPLLRQHFKRIAYIGSAGIEKQILANYPDVEFYEISAAKLKRSLSLSNLVMPLKVLCGISQTKKLLKKIRPAVVFSKGGFVALPVCMAAKSQKINVVSHESDLTMGLANKIIYKCAKRVCTSFEETGKGYEKCLFTGTAIREELFKGQRESLPGIEALDKSKKTVLVIGGSLGAKSINEALYGCAEKLCARFNVVHICGKGNLLQAGDKTEAQIKTLPRNFLQFEFLPNPAHAFKAADLVVSRAGSNAIFEFLALNKPMLLIPLSKLASRGDQILNAENFMRNEYAMVLKNEELNKETLLRCIIDLDQIAPSMREKQKAAKLENGAQKILNQILEFAAATKK